MKATAGATWLSIVVAAGLAGCGLAKPSLPVEITTRRALLADGLVAQINNRSDKFLKVAVHLSNPTTGRVQDLNASLHPGEVQELGLLQGWVFATGDRIDIRSADHRTLHYRVP